MKKKLLTGLTGVAVCLIGINAHAAVILSSDFTGVDTSDATAPYTATNITWDDVNGIATPTGDLTFINPTGPSNVNGFFTGADQISVNYNMVNNGPWQTEFDLVMENAITEIDLTQIEVDLRLTTGSGSDNTTTSKNGRTTIELVGSVSGSLGTIDPGNSSYPSVFYTRTLDLTSLPTLDASETYSLLITTYGTGHGHNKSFIGFSLEGDVSVIPEPASLILLGLGSTLMLSRRRK